MYQSVKVQYQSQQVHNKQLPKRSFAVLLLSRLALNMQMRIVYPFLPAISRGLGVPLQTTSLLLTARAVANLSSPIYGALADRLGRRVWMLLGLVILVVGSLAVMVAPTFGMVLVVLAFLSLSKAVFDPAVLAYLGDVVPYQRRGRTMGYLALMWPASWLVGVPLGGFLITLVNWRAPFALIALLGFISLVWILLNPGLGQSPSDPINRPKMTLRRSIDWLQGHLKSIERPAWWAITVSLLVVFASENVYIVYGAWLENQFHLSVATIGVVSIVVCLAEFTAESISTGWVDRIGKRKAILVGLIINILAYLLLPVLARNLAGALCGLFLVYGSFDFSIVSTLPLISELSPKARSTLLAFNVAAMAVGRLVSSLSAVRVWTAHGIAGNTLISAAAVLAAFTILRFLIKEGAAPKALTKSVLEKA